MEAPIVIEHRDALIYMLCEAAELEHAIACQYLFAAFSLKRRDNEGLDMREAAAVHRWDHQLVSVATEEMLHLAQVNNLLVAIGAAPRVGRPNLPQRGRHYPPGVQLALVPFSERALRHFLFLERPEGIAIKDAEGFDVLEEAEPLMTEDTIVPRPQDFSTVGHLYRSIEKGFERLADIHGEEWLFIGPTSTQARPEMFGWKDLIVVSSLGDVKVAIETIVEQGEGPRGHWRDAHYGRFLEILGEYLTIKKQNAAFEPARPVIPCTVRKPIDAEIGPLVDDPQTAKVLDLFNVAYEVMLQALARFYASVDETPEQHIALANLAVGLMVRVIAPLGELVTRLPVGPSHPGMTAGPSFELFYASGYLLPHKPSAWTLLHERVLEARAFAERQKKSGGHTELGPVAESLGDLAAAFAQHRPELEKRTIEAPDTVGTLHRSGGFGPS
jgi:hypothetical protein